MILTPEQTALIPIYREKWQQIGLSVKPIDRQQAAAAINTAYNIIGFPEPEIIFCDSPLEALLAIHPLSSRGELWLETANAIRNKIHNELYDRRSSSARILAGTMVANRKKCRSAASVN